MNPLNEKMEKKNPENNDVRVERGRPSGDLKMKSPKRMGLATTPHPQKMVKYNCLRSRPPAGGGLRAYPPKKLPAAGQLRKIGPPHSPTVS